MGCVRINVPPQLKSALLDEWAAIKETDGKPIEAEWYRMQARKVRAVTDADVLRSTARGDRFPVKKDGPIGLSDGPMFWCGPGINPETDLCGCGQWADFLCDAPVGDGKACDLPVCDACRIQGTNGRQRWDFCPRH